jgi:hypothetical protein
MIIAKSKHTDLESDNKYYVYETTIELCCKPFEGITFGYRDWSIRMKFKSHNHLYLYIGEKCYGHFCPFCYAPVNIIDRKRL